VAPLFYKAAAVLLMVLGSAAALFRMGKTSAKLDNANANLKARDERRKLEKNQAATDRRIDKHNNPDDIDESIDRM